MRFICPEHGVVNGVDIKYSLPAVAKCPVCGRKLTDVGNRGIRQLDRDDAKKVRPNYDGR